mgnify:CR=1 FL=1|tara:strand:+ start:1273 stop:2214 length:942 start_codon:yes stop_codon:yes gene_type:complete
MRIEAGGYIKLLNNEIDISSADSLTIEDHYLGFDIDLTCKLLDSLHVQNYVKKIYTQYIIDSRIKQKYPSLDIEFSVSLHHKINLHHFENYNIHPSLNFKNFICSFNGVQHVSRQLLASTLNKFGYFAKGYCTKNFKNLGNKVDAHIANYVKNTAFYNKFFDCTDKFNQQTYSFGHVRFDHAKNIYNLENKLTQSFLHIVSETMATSYYPFVTEKFLYSIVTRGLFLTYAQPGWHAYIEKYYGFRLYTSLFDYRFDSIINPVERLIEIMTMIGKFSKLTPHEWHDLYLLEQDNIEFNYAHYFSKDYLKELKKI